MRLRSMLFRAPSSRAPSSGAPSTGSRSSRGAGRLISRALLVLAAALLVAAGAVGQVRGTTQLIGVDEITPGMRGYGLTVFRGTTPTRFDVEVIDVLHNFRPDQDLILIRTDHPILDSAHVVAGMSGSPIYLDGRLAGAYAYGWPFSRDPVAGVTPMANMLAELRRPVRIDAFPGAQPLARVGAAPRPTSAAAPTSRASLAGLAPFIGQEPVTATTALDAHAARLGVGPDASRSTMQPAATPLLVGGLDDNVVRMLEEQLGAFGLMVLQAGGGGSREPAPGTPTRFTDGGAVGVQLVRGDVAATAIGTVTHVDGDRSVAFGHPMLNAGQSGLPTAIARVLHVLSSDQRSFKIGEPVRSMGTLVHDRQSGIVVDSSLRAATVPVRLRIHGVPDAPRTEWNFEVASHRVLTPVLLNAAITNALSATASDSADVMFEATSRVFVSGRQEPHEVTDAGYSRMGAANAMALSQLRVFTLLEATYGNPFEEARAERVEVDLSVRFARDTLRILDASVAQREVDPGSTVAVRVITRRYGQPEEVRVVPVDIPERLAGQSVEVFVQGGGAVAMQHAQSRNLDDLLEAVHERYSNESMIVSLETSARGLRFAGHVVSHLPASALDTLQLRNDGDRTRPYVTFDRHEIPLDQVVSGAARVELVVRDVATSTARSSAPTPSARRPARRPSPLRTPTP